MERLLGVDIGGTDVKLGVLTVEGEILESGAISTRAEEGPGSLARRVGEWVAALPGGMGGISRAGVDCAGLVDRQGGILRYSPNLPGWKEVPIASVFSKALGVCVDIENDVNAAVWGEYVLGSGRGTESFVALTLGTGVGGGIVAGGRLYRGAQGMAGEVGHHVIDRNGPECLCGSRGCVEAFIGARAIIDRAVSAAAAGGAGALAGMKGLTVKDISRAASEGDEVAIRVLAETGRYLGICLANIVHILNPEAIAIGGGVAGAGELILGPARDSMKRHLMSEVLAAVRVVPATLGNKASFTGAALLAAEDR